MHSDARLDLYPWGQSYDPAPNDADLHNIASHFGALNASPPGNGYTVQQSVGLYPTDGASDDSTYGMLGAAGFTIELNSGGSFTPPYSTVNTDWNANRGALIYLSKIARAPYLTTRGPDSSVVATNPMTVTQVTPSLLSGTMNYTWTANGYVQNVAAAEYYIDSSPWTGGTPTAMQATDGSFNSPTEQVQATIDTSALSTGRHILLVRGRGVNDYEGNHSWGPISAAFLDVLPPGGATWTPTPVVTTIPTTTPTITPTSTPWTPGPGCAALFGTGSTTCSAPSTYNYSFTFYNESGCTTSATGSASISFEVAQNIGGPFTSYDTQVREVTFPPGPSYVTFTGTFTETNIPSQYTAYRFYFNASAVRLLASATSTPNTICGTGGGSLTPSITPTGTVPTSTPTNTLTSTPTGTLPTATSSATPTPCNLTFTDVPPGSTFYVYIRCLACLGIVNGYPDGTFHPNNNVTRGQLAKILANAAGFSDPQSTQMFQDVPPGSTFFVFIGRLASRGYIGGYPCGGPGEPCVPPDNLPYYRTNSNATRGQEARITACIAGSNCTGLHSGQTFEDVPPDSSLYPSVEWLAELGVMSGYPCGSSPIEPCNPPANRPYFRPSNNVTRGQTSKITVNTFFPSCNPPTGRK
jgi:hypothetical protein